MSIWVALSAYGFISTFFLWDFWRRIAWSAAKAFGQDKPDALDTTISFILAIVSCAIFPLIFATIAIRRTYKSFDLDFYKDVLPEPETREQKKARIEREKRESIEAHRKAVNARERELDMELTKW